MVSMLHKSPISNTLKLTCLSNICPIRTNPHVCFILLVSGSCVHQVKIHPSMDERRYKLGLTLNFRNRIISSSLIVKDSVSNVIVTAKSRLLIRFP